MSGGDIALIQELACLPSRKNHVTLWAGMVHAREIQVVQKQFASASALRAEAAVYALLANSAVRIPAVLAVTDTALLTEFVAGKTLLQVLEEGEAQPMDFTPWHALARWLAAFYTETGLILGDPNLRNFIWGDDGAVYGLDFETCTAGAVLADVAMLLAHCLTYTPPQTPMKQRVARLLLRELAPVCSAAEEAVEQEVQRQIEHLWQRRRQRSMRKR